MSYVYIRSEHDLWTVGHYAPDGQWVSESDHPDAASAARRVRWLHGGRDDQPVHMDANAKWRWMIDNHGLDQDSTNQQEA